MPCDITFQNYILFPHKEPAVLHILHMQRQVAEEYSIHISNVCILPDIPRIKQPKKSCTHHWTVCDLCHVQKNTGWKLTLDSSHSAQQISSLDGWDRLRYCSLYFQNIIIHCLLHRFVIISCHPHNSPPQPRELLQLLYSRKQSQNHPNGLTLAAIKFT